MICNSEEKLDNFIAQFYSETSELATSVAEKVEQDRASGIPVNVAKTERHYGLNTKTLSRRLLRENIKMVNSMDI